MGTTTHAGYMRSMTVSLPETIAWFREAFAGKKPSRSGQILAQREAAGEWQIFDAWPPAGTPQQFYLHPDSRLEPGPAATETTKSYRYDPADPTPSIGGELLSLTTDDNSAPLLQRSDVVNYSTDPLVKDMDIAGLVKLKLWLTSSVAHGDVFASLCKVSPDGVWRTICDGIQKRPDNTSSLASPQFIEVSLGQILGRVPKGYRIGLLVSSAAHPRYLRNTGSGEPLGSAKTFIASDQIIHMGPENHSSIEFQVIGV